MKSIQKIEKHHLSDGGNAGINKYGRSYTFFRYYIDDDSSPVVETGLTRDQAYKKLEYTLKADVLEMD